MAIKLKTIIFYAIMLGGSVMLFLWIRSVGNSLLAPALGGRFSQGTLEDRVEVLHHVLLALVVIILCARGLGWIFGKIHQPPVIGEMVAGILLGPSLLGRVFPGASAYLLPPAVAPFLSVIAQVGIILYMFLVGVELNTDLLRGRTEASVATSHASIIAPFLLGSLLALWLYPVFSSRDVPFVVFALFMGVSMSVTAFPILARILTDRQMDTSAMGAIAVACAAVDDVTAWCLFAFVVSVARAHAGHVLITLSLTIAFILAVLFLVRPAALWFTGLYTRRWETDRGSIVFPCAALLLAALATERIGIHAIFGAFLIGVVIPHNSLLAYDIKQKFEDVAVILFLPTFFAFTGLRTQIGLVHGLRDWLICLAIIGVASLGKFGGGAIAARLTGLPGRQAAGLGILMNTRGLMELIVLNVGMDLGVLPPTLFAMLVIMAIVTTLVTTPVLDALRLAPEAAAPS
jgi:Kef-type K+ transport system membrane component KefB